MFSMNAKDSDKFWFSQIVWITANRYWTLSRNDGRFMQQFWVEKSKHPRGLNGAHPKRF